ncbi:MAG: response regulator transcription factor [Candidatus Dormibacteria bacterium]
MTSKQVLLVEDEANIRDTLRFNLTREGYVVREARTGGEALRLLRSNKPDIVLLDVMLPEMSGFEVCRIIRKDNGVPIIMLTAKDQEVDKVIGLGVGADDYITKPFGLRELFARMTAVLRRAEAQAGGVPAPPDMDEIGNVLVDRAARRVVMDGADVKLTAREFDLLSFLLANPGRAHSRNYLLQQVWKYNYVGDAKTVDVHIRWLRRKFEGRVAFEIVTVRGVGYRLDRPGGQRTASTPE